MLTKLKNGSHLFKKNSLIPNQPIAVVDVDDVMYPCTAVLLDHFNNHFETDHKFEDIKVFHLEKLFPQLGNKHEFLQHIIHQVSDYMLRAQPYVYAQDLCASFQKAGFYVAITTSRGFHPHGYHHTHQMLTDHAIPYDCLATVGIQDSKLDFVLEHIGHSVEWVVEDNLKILQEFSELGVRTMKFERPWNTEFDSHDVAIPCIDCRDTVVGIVEEALSVYARDN